MSYFPYTHLIDLLTAAKTIYQQKKGQNLTSLISKFTGWVIERAHSWMKRFRRLLWRLVWQAPATPEGVLYWSRWRRRHQARAKHFHIKRRAARLAA
jgi:hypothetical protein